MHSHSIRLIQEKCKGCTNCLRGCPTEAIRVREGKARITDARCIDCGECLRACPYHAKVAFTDHLEDLKRFDYRIAIPAPALMGQFRRAKSVGHVLAALKSLGFDDVYEAAYGADVVTRAVAKRLKQPGVRPLLSSACPAVVRLIQVRFPELIPYIVPVAAPMEVAAAIAKESFSKAHNVPVERIGAFFISPCAAKVTSVKSPLGASKSPIDGVIPISEVYGPMSAALDQSACELEARASAGGVCWARSGGEANALGVENFLAVDGIHDVIRVLERIEDGLLSEFDFFEGLACVGGCVGGPLAIENNFVARGRVKRLSERIGKKAPDPGAIEALLEEVDVELREPIEPRQVMQLDDDVVVAMHKLEELEAIEKELPGLDCGSCGAPNCRALAEDIVRGQATGMECIFKFKEKLRSMGVMVEGLDYPENRDGAQGDIGGGEETK